MKYLVNPITFESLEQKIQQKVFRSADEFLSETKWFLHNVYLLDKGTYISYIQHIYISGKDMILIMDGKICVYISLIL